MSIYAMHVLFCSSTADKINNSYGEQQPSPRILSLPIKDMSQVDTDHPIIKKKKCKCIHIVTV